MGQPDLPDLPAIASRLGGRVLGIDAGGSSTRMVTLAAGGITAWPDAAPMNALLTGNLVDRLHGLISRAGHGAAAVGIGMPGLPSESDGCQLAAALAARTGCRVRVTGDAQVAALGAFLGAPGIVVIAGTGSAAAGSDGQRWALAGGHGFLLGDEGSAYWIGRQAVRAALRWQDHLGGSGLIHQAVTAAAGASLDDLIAEVHTSPADRQRLASLAPVITALAMQDTESRRIARRAARQLAALAAAVRGSIGALPVAGAGGVFGAPVVWDRFAQLTGAVRPLAPPAVGAALLAADWPARSAR